MKTAVKPRDEKGEIEHEDFYSFEEWVPVSGECSE